MARESFSEFFRVLLKRLAQNRKEARFSEDPQKLHQVFYNISRNYASQFPELSELHFITAGAHPYSPELTEALDILQMSGAISRQNPSYEFFSVRYYDDTDAVVQRDLNELIGQDAKRANAFEEIVRSLDTALVA
jgi:hypothetical protein